MQLLATLLDKFSFLYCNVLFEWDNSRFQSKWFIAIFLIFKNVISYSVEKIKKKITFFIISCNCLQHPPRDWNQRVPLFMWLKQDLPRILTDSLEPCHFHQLNGFYKPLPSFRHMLWPSPSAPQPHGWSTCHAFTTCKAVSCLWVYYTSILYINQMTLSRIFLIFFGKFIPMTKIRGDRRDLL